MKKRKEVCPNLKMKSETGKEKKEKEKWRSGVCFKIDACIR